MAFPLQGLESGRLDGISLLFSFSVAVKNFFQMKILWNKREPFGGWLDQTDCWVGPVQTPVQTGEEQLLQPT